MITRSSLVFLAGVAAVATLIVTGLFTAENPESTPRPNDAAEPTEAATSQENSKEMTRPLAPRVSGIPVLTPSGVDFIDVTAEGHSQSGIVVQINGENRGSSSHGHWEDLAYTAAHIALTILDNPPKGLRVGITTNNAEPMIEQLAPLVLAINVGVRGEQYPPDVLVTDLVTPGGLLLSLHRVDRMAKEAKAHGLRVGTATSVAKLVAQWSGSAMPEQASATLPKTKPAPMQVASEVMQKNLPHALSDLNRGHTVHRPLPDGWSKVRERLLSKLRQANPTSTAELVDVAFAGAQALEAVRLAEFGAQMLGPFTERIARRKLRKPKHWETAWLVLLLESRFDGEQAVVQGIRKIPQGSASKSLPAHEWLTTQQQQVAAINPRLKRLLERIIKPRVKQPKPYPWHDARHITWVKGKTIEAPTATTSWGVAISRFYTLWAQLIITRTIDPERNLDVAASGALVVDDEPHLRDLVVTAKAQLVSLHDLVLARLGKAPDAIRALVALGTLHPNAEVHERVAALEKILIAAGFAQQALLIHKSLDNSGN